MLSPRLQNPLAVPGVQQLLNPVHAQLHVALGQVGAGVVGVGGLVAGEGAGQVVDVALAEHRVAGSVVLAEQLVQELPLEPLAREMPALEPVLALE